MSHSSCVLSKDVIPQWNLTTEPRNTVITNYLNLEVKFDRLVLGMVWYRMVWYGTVETQYHTNTIWTTSSRHLRFKRTKQNDPTNFNKI